MPIRELFHVVSIVEDFDEAAALTEALFSPLPIMDKSWSDFDKRWASIGMIGPDFPLELMEPSTDPADIGAPLVKFKARFGERLHSLSWFVDRHDHVDVVRRMQESSIRVVGPDGRPVGDTVPSVIFTHGRDTLGQLEFMEVGPEGPALAYPQFTGNWGHRSPTWWRDEHPLGIIGLSHITVAAIDVARAMAVFADALGGRVLSRHDHGGWVLVGKETVIEVATSDDASSDLASDVAQFGELPYCCTFLVKDLDAAQRHATAVGTHVLYRDAHTVALDPRSTFGTRFAFTDAPVSAR